MYSVDLVSDKAAFLALEGEWNDAVDRAAVSHPFLRHEWVRTWWEAFGGQGARQLHVLVVRRGSRMISMSSKSNPRSSTDLRSVGTASSQFVLIRM
jgi:hypothetical protein